MVSLQEEMKEFLKHEDRLIPRLLVKIEKATSVNREHLLYGFGSIFALYLIFGDGAALLCNAIGVIYPILASVKSIQLSDQEGNAHWLQYWIVFGAYCLLDEIIGSWPLYWLLKCVALLVLYSPTYKGAERAYLVLAPILNRVWAAGKAPGTKDDPSVNGEQTVIETQCKITGGSTPPSEPDGYENEY